MKTSDMDRTAIYQANFIEVKHEIDISTTSGGSFVWELIHPSLLLMKIISNSNFLQQIFGEVANTHPCTRDKPWGLVVGFDECTPGNKQKTDNRKKIMNVNFSFIELGCHLASEDFWFTPISVRSTLISTAQGGWSRMLKDYLVLQLLSDQGLYTAGVPLMLNGELFLLFANLKILLSDGDGLRMALQWKGASGLKPCARHFNVYKKGSDLAHRLPGYCEITCTRHEELKCWNVDQFKVAIGVVLEARARFHRGELVAARLKDVEKSYGYAFTADGLCADLHLQELFDIQRVIRKDWAHTLLQHGTLTVEAWLLIKACETEGVCRQEDLRRFMFLFCRPKHRRNLQWGIWNIFSDFSMEKNRERDALKTSQSELLTIYGVLRVFFQIHTHGVASVEPNAKSYTLCCSVVDLILLAKKGVITPAVAAGRLKVRVGEFLEQHIAVYGVEFIIPKHHWMWDIVEQLEDDDFVHDMFSLERLHLRARRSADEIDNTICYERSVLSGVLNHHLRHSLETDRPFGLSHKVAPFPGVAGAFVADSLSIHGFQCSINDYVWCGTNPGLVVACCAEALHLMVVVDVLTEKLEEVTCVRCHPSFWHKNN